MAFVQKVGSNVTCFGRVFLIFEGCGLSPDSATYLAWFEVGVTKGCVAGKGNGRATNISVIMSTIFLKSGDDDEQQFDNF